MKKCVLILISLIILIVLVPVICILVTGGVYEYKKTNEILVYVVSEDKTVKMDTEQYIKEVVSAEMPVEFEDEALKAQAVAARTYLASKIYNGENPDHPQAVICTDYKHCQAWISEDERKKSWESDKAEEYWKKISLAVDETSGEILTFDGSVISALFHSTSSGKTESAKDVWGGDKPYLVSVESPGDEFSPKFYAEKQMSVLEYINTVKEKYPEADEGAELFSEAVTSEAGGIITVKVLGVVLKGTEFRTLFDLRSTNVEFILDGETVLIKTKGNGHGVGMSQYGANYYAQQGQKYSDILKHYYSGVEIEKMP